MENYGLIINLLAVFNALNEGIGNVPMFTYRMHGSRLRINSYSTQNIANLFSLLWATTNKYCVYLEENELEVLFIGDR